MKRWLPLCIFLGLAVLLAAGVVMSRRPDRDALPSTLLGKAAPQFALPDLYNPQRTVHLADFAGKPFLLNVWGSWCVSCREEHQTLSVFAAQGKVPVIGYNWKDEPADAKRWLAQLGNPYTVVVSDVEGRTAIDLGVYGAPETYLIDGQGRVRWKHVGVLTQAVIDQQLKPLLATLDVRAP